MMNLQDLEYVKGLKSNMESAFGTPQGQEVMKFLEMACGWYESIFDPEDRDRILINAGRREVIATIKTLLQQPPEHIVALAQRKEQ